MALIFFEAAVGDSKTKVWYDASSDRIMDRAPTTSEKIMDIVLSHSRYHHDLAEIILACRQIMNNGYRLKNITISEKAIDGYLERHSFSNALSTLQEKLGLVQIEGFPIFYGDLRQLCDYRNQIAHKDFLDYFIYTDRILKIVDDNQKYIILNLGKQQILRKKEDIDDAVDDLFQKYTVLCRKYSPFFCMTLADKLIQMNAGKLRRRVRDSSYKEGNED